MSCSDSSKLTEAECVTPAVWTPAAMGGRRALKAKTLRRMLKKKGLKTTGKKSTLMKRLKMKGGMLGSMPIKGAGGDVEGGVSGGRRRRRTQREEGGRRRRSRKLFGLL